MGDIDDAGAVRPQARDDVEQTGHFAIAERRGRLVHDEDACARADGFRNLHELLLGHAERLDEPFGIDVRPDARKEIRRKPPASPQSIRRHSRRSSSANAMFSATVRCVNKVGC